MNQSNLDASSRGSPGQSNLGAPLQGSPGQWPYFACIALALWLLSSPFSMQYPSAWLRTSDIVSGVALIALSVSALVFRLQSIKWVLAGVGLWLTAAPLIFWAPDAASYANDTLIGSLVLLCSVIIPSLSDPAAESGHPNPTDWSYNPSSWKQRTPIIGLAFLGFLMARYLSAFQLGHTTSVWDPFFGEGTKTILTSSVSRWFPVSDAGLGAWSYLLDALSGTMGGTRRWRTMPWVVVLFGVMIIPPGVTSITLVILQPVAVGAWCTICLATAVIMLLMVPPAVDEVVATIQALITARRRGASLWKSFWFGIPEEILVSPSPKTVIPIGLHKRASVPWNLTLCTALGVWCMATPTIFRAQGLASDANHILGALIVTFSVIAMAQVTRPIRFLNCLLGLLLATTTWFLESAPSAYHWSSAAAGILLTIFSLPLGKISDQFGNYDRWVTWNPRRLRRRETHKEDQMAA